MMRYSVRNWYWIVAGDGSRVWSSAAAAYVPVTDAAYEAWLAAGNLPTKIDTEENLQQVFTQQYPAGWPGLQIRAELAALDALLPRALENYWEATGFDTATLHHAQLAILHGKQALRALLSS